ncbi:unnamed protein product [Cuscuta epithymum]|uniref:Polygalacturonase n=1 Tax=Cuscuta epithymum TaxID=186058 RepID=A0AAV0DDK4_9ASTE|nr:unnamed protein product [Cuscuta epithymum]
MFLSRPLAITITIIFSLSCLDCFPIDDKRIVINVDHFGARGDGHTDDSEAFSRAWKKFCETEKGELLIPPTKTYLLKPMSLDGPCRQNLKMKISGTIKASPNKRDYEVTGRLNWMVLRYLDYFHVDGDGNKGTIDGSGKTWWKDSCNFKETATCDKGLVPFSVMFENSTNLKVENLSFKNAQKMHLTFNVTRNVEASHIKIQAPEDSPNTDGIHVSGSYNVTITNSNIATGDDCVSIVNKTTMVRVLDTQCGPGHGIR